MQSLPIILVSAVLLVMGATRVVQAVQSHVLHVLPVGALSTTSLSDTCVGILISGVFMMYFGGCSLRGNSWGVGRGKARGESFVGVAGPRLSPCSHGGTGCGGMESGGGVC